MISRQCVSAALTMALLFSFATACGDKKAAQSPGQSSSSGGEHASVEVTGEPTDTSNGGMVLHVSKKVEGKTSANLVATYTWGGKPARKAWVSDAGDSWRLQFQDLPAPDEITVLELAYELPLDSNDDKELKEVADLLADAYLDAAIEAQAADTPDEFEAEFLEQLQDLKPLLQRLERFRAQGKPGQSVVLAALGLAMTDSGELTVTQGGWKLTELAAWRHLLSVVRPAEEKHWALAKGADCGAKALKRDAVTADIDAQLPQCVKAFGKEFDDLASAYEKDNAAVTGSPFADVWTSLKAAVDALEQRGTAGAMLGDVAQPGATPLHRDLETVFRAHAALVTKKPAPDAAHLAPDRLQSYHAIEWLLNRRFLAAAEAEAHEKLTSGIEETVRTLQQEQEGSILLERAQGRRHWDVATGAVYVAKLEDTLLPIMIAFCPAGCLRVGEHAFSGPTYTAKALSLMRTFSLDVGVQLGILDRETDSRHSDRPSFLLGASFNPFYFFRGSVGTYVFENAQTNDWNRALYVGATINIIHAAELLGPLGMNRSDWTVTTDKR